MGSSTRKLRIVFQWGAGSEKAGVVVYTRRGAALPGMLRRISKKF